MVRKNPIVSFVVPIVVAMALVTAACGGDDGQDATAAAPESSVEALAADVGGAGETGGAATDASGEQPSLAVQVAVTGGDPAVDNETTTSVAGDDDPTTTSDATGASTSSTAGGALQVTTGSSTSTTAADSPLTSSTTASSGTASPNSSTSTTAAGPTTTRSTTTTTAAPTTTTTAAPTTTTTSGPSGDGYFRTLPVGASLPSGAACAAQVKARPEVRAGNATFNATRGSGTNDRYPRVDGNFTGTTDEIIQWAACKWGIDEDWARAQSVKESYWDMTVGGDLTSDQNRCHPDVRTSSGQCPESMGLLQVRYQAHSEAFENSNAIRSTAYNADYTYAVWRACYDGELTWLNDVERGRHYSAGDLEGCLGVWFSGRWYVPRAETYIADVRNIKDSRTWESANFLNYG